MKKGIAFAILAAALYAINAPFSKILLDCIPPTLMAGFLYVGAGIGMIIIALVRKIRKTETNELKLTKSELPYTVAMILLDIAAPICLMFGLNATTAANASLLNNFEIVATAIIALMIFKEKISPRLWFGILFITVSCGILSFEDLSSLQFTYGSLFVLLAAVCWGFENNCTRKLFIASGLSIYFYVYAQRLLGAARTSAYYAISPFIAAILSLIIFKQIPTVTYFIALIFMVIGAWLSSNDNKN